jgi:hypothetical protein
MGVDAGQGVHGAQSTQRWSDASLKPIFLCTVKLALLE